MEETSPRPDLDASRLVPVARAWNRMEADEILNALRQEGIDAEWWEPHSNWFDGLEHAWMGEKFGQILVLDVNLLRARGIVEELRAAEGKAAPEG